MPKSNKTPQTNSDDIERIQNDVASFASSLGLASSLPSSGFNDVDFRPKKKPQQKEKKKNNNQKPQNDKPTSENPQKQKPRKDFPQKEKPRKEFGQNEKPRKEFGQNEKPRNISAQNQKPRKEFGQNEKPRKEFGQSEKPRKEFGKNEEESKKETNLTNIDDEVEVQSYKPIYEKYRNMPKLALVKAGVLGVWYEDESELEGRVIGEKKVEIGKGSEWRVLVDKKKELGERLMAQYTFDYESSRGQSSDIRMLATTQRSGTAADKVSAYSVLIGDNPIANLRSLDALVAMVTSKVGKRHALTGFEALKELFLQSLLPDRKLKTLFQRPLNHLPETKDGYSLLLFWYWEDCLKTRYERFVSALEEASRDVLRILKDKALKIMYALLRSKSEQERKILTALVNKLGDPDSKAASNADYYLTNLLSDHPNMKVVVIDEVDAFLFRPHLGLRAKYHAVNFLTQIRLSHHGDGPTVAKRLVEVYFALFKVLISAAENGTKDNKNKEIKKSFTKDEKAQGSSEFHVEMDSRLLSALLTGVNRAFPFVSGDAADEILDVQTPMLFRLVHSQNFNVGIQSLMLIDKISSKNQVVSDRFYRSLYAKLLLPAALNTSKAEMFIGLLLRAMKNDVNLKRVSAFSKRLLQVALQQPPQYACACLFLLSEVLKARPPLWNTAIQSETVDDDIEHFEDVPDEAGDDEPSTDGKVPQSNNGGGASNNNDSDSESENEEAVSAPSSDDDTSDEEELFRGGNVEKPMVLNATLSDHDRNKPQESSTKNSLPGGYDPRHREPSFCNADNTSWWELTVLASHAHPSVATMARTLLSGATIVYNGNPLKDLSLTAFLDKFMEKKPKQSTWHGGSQIEPAKKLDINKHLLGPEIVSLAEDDVAPEDLVFHKFYVNKMSTSAKPKKKKKKTAEEVEAEDLYGGDESDNEEIDNLLDATEPSIAAEGDYDYDDLDNVADDDDDDLIDDVSDNEMDDMPSDIGEGDDDDAISDDDDINVGDADDLSDDDILGGADGFSSDDDINIGDEDDGFDDEDDELPVPKKGKKKSKKSSASPFASAEEYEHLLNDDIDSDEDVGDDQKDKKSRKKKRKHAQTDDNEKTDSAEKSGKRKKKKGKTQH